MWIERIEVENFLLFKHLAVSFDSGLNVVFGPNEGGKSSLFKAISAALFSDVSSRGSESRAFARWGCRMLFRLEVDFFLGAEKYRLVRDFADRYQAIESEGGKTPIARGKNVNEFLRNRLPISDRRLFERVAAVSHEELSLVSEDSSGISDMLEEILAGTGEAQSPAEVASYLRKKLEEMRRGLDRPANRENWGPVKRFSEEKQLLEKELVEARENVDKRSEITRKIATLTDEIRRVDEKIGSLSLLIRLAKSYIELKEKLSRTKKKAEELRKRKERAEKLIESYKSAANAMARSPERLRNMELEELFGIKSALEREKELESLSRSKSYPRTLFSVLLFAGLICLVAGAALGYFFARSFFFMCVVGAMAMILYFLRGKIFVEGGAIAYSKELQELRKSRSEWAGDRGVEDARSLLYGMIESCSKIREMEARLDELSSSTDISKDLIVENLDREYGNSSLETRALEEELREIEPYALEAEVLLQKEKEARDLASQRESLQQEISKLEKSLAALPESDLALLRERYESVTQDLSRARRKSRVLEIAGEVLEEARRRVSLSLASSIPRRVEEILSRLSEGRYCSIYMDPHSMAIELVPADTDGDRGDEADEIPERISPEYLSQGTRDIVYLAVRLALVEFLSSRESQPIFLDDPFVHLDPRRRLRAIEMVRQFSSSHQILLFTCDPAYRDIGAHLVEIAR